VIYESEGAPGNLLYQKQISKR